VSSLSFIRAIGRDKAGYRANLRCDCKHVGTVRMSSKRPTLQDCLREIGRLIQRDHDPTCVDAAQKLQAAEKDAVDASTKRPPDEGAASINANEVLMLHSKLKIIQARAAQANKAALEVEKARDELHNQIQQIEEQLQPKRAPTDDDAGDPHDLLAEFDNCDLSDHRREGTRVQNRRNVQVGSRDNQQKSRTGKDGFLHHTRLGLVGWISYWCCGDAALAVVILVALINTIGLTELVSDALGRRKQKEAETNAKIVDLLKNALDETKTCRNEQQRVEQQRVMTCVERKFELQGLKCKWEEYKGTRYSDGDSALVVELWLHRVDDDLSGLTFQEWDPSAGTDDTSAPVAMLVKSSELRAADFPLAEVSPLQLDSVAVEAVVRAARQ
jgi:hypothetical protein